MVIVVLIMILFLVEHRHQVSQHALLNVILMDLTELVKFSMGLVDLNIEQEHAPGQTVLHIHKHSLQFVVQLFVELGVLGQELMELDLELVKGQTAQLIQKQSKGVQQAAQLLVDPAVEVDHLDKPALPQLELQTVLLQQAPLHVLANIRYL